MLRIHDSRQNHQSENCSSINTILSREENTGAKENKLTISSNSSGKEIKTRFNILDHLEKLKPAKGSDRYICPVCGGNDLTIEPETGKYQCWHGCECAEIREAISPWADVTKTDKLLNSPLRCKPRIKPKKSNSAVSISVDKLVLATLPQKPTDIPAIDEQPFIPDWLKKQSVPQNATEIRYWYSKTQWVSRFEWQDKNNPKGHSKTYRQGHIQPNGNTKWSKGKNPWLPYKIDEAIALGREKWIIAVEGEPCVEALRSLSMVGITFQGSNWNDKAIEPGIKKLKDGKIAGIIYLPDHDKVGREKGQKIAEICAKNNLPCLTIKPTELWSKMPSKGDIVDWIGVANPTLLCNGEPPKEVDAMGSSMNREDFIQRLELAIHQAVDRRAQLINEIADDGGQIPDEIPRWSQSDIANWLVERYQSSLVWNTQLKEWYRYSAQIEGIWTLEPVEFIGRAIKAEIEALARVYAEVYGEKKRPTYGISLINNVIALLKLDLAIRQWDEPTGLLPLLNGVLDLHTRKLISHAPEHRLTWCLPYAYNPIINCDPIVDWLTTMCGGDLDLVQLMRAYLLGVVTGRTDWQKYLELIGAGGTGKSTFTRLAIALVGANNTHTTNLKKLEEDKFETASIAGKRLVLINDSERYGGSVSTLKALTGQDTLPYEVKFKQCKGGFTPTAMVIVAANETIQSRDYTSGLERRRVTVPMSNKISSQNQRNLIEHRNGEIFGEFAQYIPGLLNWVLEMDEESATRIIKNYRQAVPRLAAMKAQTLVESNPIADWLDNNIVYEKDCRTNIGVANRDKDSGSSNWYLNTDRWLYANYAEYCHNTGCKAISLRRFVSLLSDLCQNQLDLDIEKGRDRYGSFIRGLKIRTDSDLEAPLITGKLPPTDINTQIPDSDNPLPTVMNNVADKVTAESIDSNESDRCDENFASQPQKLDSEKIEGKNFTASEGEDLQSPVLPNQTLSSEDNQSQPVSKPSSQSQPIAQSITKKSRGLQPNDLVKYVGTYYSCYKDRVLTVKTVSRSNGINCYTDTGEVTTWLSGEDLEHLI